MAIKHTFMTKEGTETKVITKAKAIRMKCVECSGWQTAEVIKCVCYTCALYPFRFGNEKGLERKYIPEENTEDIEEDSDEEVENTEDIEDSDEEVEEEKVKPKRRIKRRIKRG